MSDSQTHELFMKRAFDLALLGCGHVSPNPMVGCVIVHQGNIIGEGYHRSFGGPHAEVNAINNVKNPELLPYATAYVSLEPCSHTGKTPPCAELLVEVGIRHVLISNVDPNPLVAGKGIAYLQDNGVKVETGMLSSFGEDFNRRFFKVMRTRRPYIILKWAETGDGYIADAEHKPIKISNSLVDIQVHRWRAEEDAILVGMQTVLTDNPRLSNRHWHGAKNPKRIVLGTWADIPTDAHLLDDSQETIVFDMGRQYPKSAQHFTHTSRIEMHTENLNLDFVLDQLYQKGIHSVLVEGGAKTLAAFINAGCYDEIRQIKNTGLNLENGIEAPNIPKGIAFSYQERINDNILSVYKKTIPTK